MRRMAGSAEGFPGKSGAASRGKGVTESILIWQWGRRGGGPRMALDLAKALARTEGVEATLAISRQAEIYREAAASGLPLVAINTYRGPLSAAVGSLRL